MSEKRPWRHAGAGEAFQEAAVHLGLELERQSGVEIAKGAVVLNVGDGPEEARLEAEGCSGSE